MKKKLVGIGIGILVMLCIAAIASVVPIKQRGGQHVSSDERLRYDYDAKSGNGRPGVPPPHRGNCGNVSKSYLHNPFEGWPLEFHAGDWRTVSAWFCDPHYKIDMGADHWGIDLAALVEAAITPEGRTEILYRTVYGARIVATLKPGIYGWVKSARLGGYNFGMGSHVKIMALDCTQTCGRMPAYKDIEPGEHYWILQKSSAKCADVISRDDDFIETGPKDLLLSCTELGWVATYMHMEEVFVEPDDLVERGDVLGTVDSTGNSTGHHLHYQINAPGKGAIDPAPSMCPDYSPELRMTNRAHREMCWGSGGVNPGGIGK